ncbi:ATP-binding cassette domain-containing protein [Hoeflea alexandrii]
MALADRVTVIRQGKIAFSAAVAETSGEEIASHIVDGSNPVGGEIRRGTPGPVVLDVAGLSAEAVEKSHPLHDISFAVHSGEIVGLAGVAGNGQVELMEALSGLRQAKGRVELAGIDLGGLDAERRRAAGMGYISPDRRHEGLAIDASIEENAIAGSHRASPISNGLWVDRGAMKRVALERLNRLSVKYGALRDPVASLSGATSNASSLPARPQDHRNCFSSPNPPGAWTSTASQRSTASWAISAMPAAQCCLCQRNWMNCRCCPTASW